VWQCVWSSEKGKVLILANGAKRGNSFGSSRGSQCQEESLRGREGSDVVMKRRVGGEKSTKFGRAKIQRPQGKGQEKTPTQDTGTDSLRDIGVKGKPSEVVAGEMSRTCKGETPGGNPLNRKSRRGKSQLGSQGRRTGSA